MRVSVICPVFNARPDELRAAAASVLGQDGGEVHELIVVDDASTSAETKAALADLAGQDARVVLLPSVRNAGPAAARNQGLARASGEWVGFIDADDIWPGGKLARAAAALSLAPDSRWIIGDFANFRGDARDPVKPGASCFPRDETGGARQCSPALTRSIISDGLHLGTCLIRRELIGERRFDPLVLYGEDLLFLAKLSTAACADRAAGLSYLCRRGGASMMYSPARLGARFASGARAGLRDRELRAFRRQYRWALYDIYKELAVNNLLNGRPAAGLWFALHALLLDPREIGSMARFIGLLPVRDRAELARQARSYSRREQVVLGLDRP